MTERASVRNGINVYTCPDCGGETVTIDVDPGVTPALLHRPYAQHRAPACRGLARSSWYQPRPGHPPPAWEWYRPTEEEARAAGPAMAEHARLGGLFIRPRSGSQEVARG